MKTSAITLGRFDVAAVMLSYLIFWWSGPLRCGLLLNRRIYQLALLMALLQALWHGWLILKRQREDYFRTFRAQPLLGMTMFVGIALAHGRARHAAVMAVPEETDNKTADRGF
jgi:4-hydroxybenzoate polyprenyltransferase